ncbi:hypothetical protein ACFU7Y_20540 [Kitasatospora sp. NPDC057542]|uniref:hypothetical protein n=1 Tax=Kitasatospora sp. NPDC057542 TaxID=3346162 RepID=UPI003685D1B9
MSADRSRARRAAMSLAAAWVAAVALVSAPPARANDFTDQACKLPFMDTVCGGVAAVTDTVEFVTDPLGYVARVLTKSVTSSLNSMTQDLKH